MFFSLKHTAPEDKANTAKQELDNCYKKIAGLETRIHDLTLRTSIVSIFSAAAGWSSRAASDILSLSVRVRGSSTDSQLSDSVNLRGFSLTN